MFESLLSLDRLREVRQNGVIVFDVDDTLLMRRKNSSGPDQVYTESEAAKLIPGLLHVGFRVCLITGHGWRQLEERLIIPLVSDTVEQYFASSSSALSRLFVYANRGATKLSWQEGQYIVDNEYGRDLSIDTLDRTVLFELVSGLRDLFIRDFEARTSWYVETFTDFPFAELPPDVFERDGIVLGLRPLPSDEFCTAPLVESPRRMLASYGGRRLQRAGLGGKYDVSERGRSTLEITKKIVSKSVAFRDLISRIAADLSCSVELVERAALYIGDEFAPGGNDRVISTDFHDCQCLSVAPASGFALPSNVTVLLEHSEHSDSVAALSRYIVEVLVGGDLSANLFN